MLRYNNNKKRSNTCVSWITWYVHKFKSSGYYNLFTHLLLKNTICWPWNKFHIFWDIRHPYEKIDWIGISFHLKEFGMDLDSIVHSYCPLGTTEEIFSFSLWIGICNTSSVVDTGRYTTYVSLSPGEQGDERFWVWFISSVISIFPPVQVLDLTKECCKKEV